MAQCVDARRIRQRKIEQCEVARTFSDQVLRLNGSRNQLHGKSLRFQFLAKNICQRYVILSNKDAHRLTQNGFERG